MRDITTLNTVEDFDGSTVKTIVLKDIPKMSIPDYDLTDSTEKKKYLASINKKIVRNSLEYRAMVKYLRENMGMNKCSFYTNVNNIDTFKIKIHLHHHPFTLEDIIETVYNKRVALQESLDEEDVGKEVMYIHYMMMVGLIPLAETPHELVHNNFLFIPVDKVCGFYENFVNCYHDYIEADILDKYERNVEYSKVYNEADNMQILTKKYIYVDITGKYDLPSLESVVEAMNNRLDQIRIENGKKNQVIDKSHNNNEMPPAIIIKKKH